MRVKSAKTIYSFILIPLIVLGISFYSSAFSRSGSVLTTFAPGTPTAEPANSISTNSFNGTWNTVFGATEYHLDVSTSPTFSSFVSGYNDLTVLGTSQSVVGLIAGQTYYYRVRAYDGFAFSGNSNIINVTTITEPPIMGSPTLITGTSFRINWLSSNGATGYQVDVSTQADFSSFFINAHPVTGAFYNVTGLSQGITYYYRVRAVTSGGPSLNSSVENITTIPVAPIATSASSIFPTEFTANWNTVSGAIEYRLDLSLYSTFSSFIAGYADFSVNTNSLLINGLVEGQTYYYRVRAISTGGSSSNSNTIAATTIPLSPLANAASNIAGTSFTANWSTVSGATEYRVDVANNPGFTPSLGSYSNRQVLSNSVSVTGLTSTTTYYYRIRSRSSGGDSDHSNVIIVPGSPVAISASGATTNSFIANWNSVNGANEYRLDVSTDVAFNNILPSYESLQVLGTSQSILGLTEGTIYYYRVRSVSTGGTSISSNVINITTIPEVPVAVVATSVAAQQFVANWNAVPGASSYRIDVSASPDFDTYILNNVSVATNSRTVTGLVPGSTYYYTVKAVSSGGISDYSNVVSVTTIPETPVALAGSAITASQFTANWGIASGAVDYELDVATNASFSSFVVSGYVTTAINTVISPLNAGTTYYYRVRARNVGGTTVNSTTITVVTTPPVPALNTANNITTTSFNARWIAATGATSYLLDVSTNNLFSSYILNGVSVTNTFRSVTGLTPGTQYFYRVRAVNSGGTSDYSSSASTFTITEAPNTNPATFISTNGFTANWQTVTGATSYQVDVSLYNDFSSVSTFNVIGGTVSSYAVSGLSAGQTYYYRVRGVNSGGTSASSPSPTTVVTLCIPPTANSATAVTGTSFIANWSNVSGATGYLLDVATDAGFSAILPSYSNFSISGNSYSTTGLSEGTQYYYRVRAENSSGVSGNSAVISVVTISPPPNALPASNVSQNSFLANWASTSGASNYLIDVSTNGTFSSFVGAFQNFAVAGTSINVASLSSGTTYYYRVRASNSNGTSGYSSIISVTTIPNAPVALSFSGNNGTSFTANWSTIGAATSYRLDVSTNSSFSSFVAGYNDKIVNGNSDLVGGLTPNQTYYYRIRSVNVSGASSNSNTIIVPGSPVATSATENTSSSFIANWNSVTDAIGYRLDVASDNGFTNILPAYNNLAVTLTYDTVIGLSSGSNYYYRVRAITSGGTSINSNVITTTTISSAPTANSANSITNTSFEANWTFTAGASSYRLDVSTDISFTSLLAGYNNLIVNATSQIVSGVQGGQVYYYRVRAVNGGGTSENSNVVNLTTIPTAPTANPGNPITTTTFRASWNAVSGALNYEMDVSSDSTFATYLAGYNSALVAVSSNPERTVSSLLAGRTYYYRVRAVSPSGESENSNIVKVVTVPGVPANVYTNGHSATSFNVHWGSVFGAASYKVDIALNSTFTSLVSPYINFDVNAQTLTVSGLNPGTRYFYRIKAVTSGGTGDNTTGSSTWTIPNPPTAIAASSITATSFTANWQSITGAARYKLEIAILSDFSAGFQEFNNITALNYNVSGLTPGQTYYYRVRALNAADGTAIPVINGTSAASNTIIVPGSPTATSPTNLSSNSFTANWNSVIGATNYHLEVYNMPTPTRVAGYEDVIVNGTSQLVTGLTPGKSYSYKVRAESSGGISWESNSIVVPGAPVVSSATSVTSSSFQMHWSLVDGAEQYRVDVSTLPGFPDGNYVSIYNNYAQTSSTFDLVVNNSISAGTTYYFRVRAIASGGASLNSNIQTVVTIANAPVATAASNISSSSFTANWNSSPSANSYRLDVSPDPAFVSFVDMYQDYPVSGTNLIIQNLETGSIYYYRLRAVNSGGISSYSNAISVRTGSVIITSPTLTGLCANSDYQILGDIVISEGSNDVFTPNADSVTFVLSAPSGFEFSPNEGIATKIQGTNLANGIRISVFSSTIEVKYLVTGSFGIEDAFRISGIKVRATGSGSTGQIRRTGGNAGQSGNGIADARSHGSLSSNTTTPASIIGLASSFCPNSDPVTLIGNPQNGSGGGVGVFSGRGVSGNMFYPTVAGTGFDTIYYSFTNSSGCTFVYSQTVLVNVLTPLAFDLPADVCKKADEVIQLQGNPAGGIFTSSEGGVSGSQSTGFAFYPNLAPLGVNNITYTYIDNNNCSQSITKSVQVNPLPTAGFQLSDNCDSRAIFFTDTSKVSTGSIAEWTWDFGDGNTSTLQHPEHIYGFDGEFRVSLSVKTIRGCTDSKNIRVKIGKTPSPVFTWVNSCFGDPTKFTDITGLNDQISERRWDFGDGTSSTDSSPEHIFSTPGVYNVKLTINTNSSCAADSTIAVSIFPYISNFPYQENFEMGTGGWVAGGVNSSWVVSTPDNAILNRAYSGAQVWITNNNGTYNNNEKSYIESPCFNLSVLSKPMISMKLWVDTDKGADGAVLQASLDNGKTWEVVGKQNEGLGWYDSSPIIGAPGGQQIMGWSGRDLDVKWKDAKFSLEKYKMATSIRFRVSFGSSSENPVNANFEGIAIDDVWIGDRTHTVLVEHFKNNELGRKEAQEISKSVEQSGGEMLDLYYHTSFPGVDQYNLSNPADPSARALFYGIEQVPNSVMDGKYKTKIFSNADSVKYKAFALKESKFKIELAIDKSIINALKLNIDVTSLDTLTAPIAVYTAITQTFMDGTYPMKYLNKLLPDAAGFNMNRSWQKGDKENVSLSWTPRNLINDSKIGVIVFVQNKLTKEIYETTYLETDFDPITGTDKDPIYFTKGTVRLYPNPANHEITLSLEKLSGAQPEYELIDLYGKVVKAGSIHPTELKVKIDVKNLSSGVYTARVKTNKGIIWVSKIVIAH